MKAKHTPCFALLLPILLLSSCKDNMAPNEIRQISSEDIQERTYQLQDALMQIMVASNRGDISQIEAAEKILNLKDAIIITQTAPLLKNRAISESKERTSGRAFDEAIKEWYEVSKMAEELADGRYEKGKQVFPTMDSNLRLDESYSDLKAAHDELFDELSDICARVIRCETKEFDAAKEIRELIPQFKRVAFSMGELEGAFKRFRTKCEDAIRDKNKDKNKGPIITQHPALLKVYEDMKGIRF